nr:hypothetical protein [Tanacetum cinerariifolium]
MARQCPNPKRKRDATWFRDKVLLVEAHGSGKVLNEEELEFLADLGVAEGPVTQTVITYNVTYQADDLDAYDSDCDDFSTAKAVLMANLSSYESYVLSKVPHSENTHNDMLNQSVQEMLYSEQTHLVNYPKNEITRYVRDTYPAIHKPSEKLVVVMPINKKKIVRKKTYENECRKIFIKNEKQVFTECEDDVMIYTGRRHRDTCDGVRISLAVSITQLQEQ